MNKYSVYYSGGSGGFMFFYSLQIALGNDVAEYVAQNWDIKDPKEWKKSETVKMGHNAPSLYNVKLRCNLVEPPEDGSISTVIYTDIDTQLLLAQLKKTTNIMLEFDIDEFIRERVDEYNRVKADDWPEVSSLDDFDTLPEHIRNELINDFNFPDKMNDWKTWVKYFQSHVITTHNGIQIHKNAKEMIRWADHSFLLQDVLGTRFRCVTDALGLRWTEAVGEHVDQWVALHPENIQERLLRDI